MENKIIPIQDRLDVSIAKMDEDELIRRFGFGKGVSCVAEAFSVDISFRSVKKEFAVPTDLSIGFSEAVRIILPFVQRESEEIIKEATKGDAVPKEFGDTMLAGDPPEWD